MVLSGERSSSATASPAPRTSASVWLALSASPIATLYKEGPLLVIASGRDTIPVASTIRRLAPENVFVIQIQHPRSRLDRFDLVITPRHDYYPQTAHAQEQIPWFLQRWITPRDHPDSHVILTVGALHHADSAALRIAAFTWHDELAYLPKPLLVVNIGGPTSNCPYGADLAKELITKLQNVLWSCGSLRISFSRRTPVKVSEMFVREFRANSKVHIWDGEGSNPHMGHLAWADAFIVTADSVSMLSEVCSTGKPVYVAGAERCKWKFADFQNSLQERGAVRAFTGKEDISETWSYPPLNDTAESAAQVHEALAKRGWRICTSRAFCCWANVPLSLASLWHGGYARHGPSAVGPMCPCRSLRCGTYSVCHWAGCYPTC